MEPDHLADLQDAEAAPAASDPGLRMDLLAALDRLSPEHREVLLLVGVEQLSYAECAQVLQLPAGTVMSRLSRARVAMRAALEGAAKPASVHPHLKRVV
jgi:RNA polymerase sigma-70 factor (ECF subfamily)